MIKQMTRQILLVTRRELKGFFDQPTAYVLAVAFLGLGLYLSFRSLYAISAATLRPFFDMLPWLLVVFMPAVTMRSLAEERRGRTLEWLIAQPLSETDVVLGKFLGSWLFILVTLAGTLPMAIGLLAVSEADPGIMFAQYLGAALLVAQMIAIGIWASSMTRNQITAFILGAFICFTLVFIGTPTVQMGMPRLIGGWLLQLSVLSHFENVGRGVIDLRDLLYFASTCGLFLLLAVGALGRERLSRRSDAFRRLRIGTGVIALAVLVLNLLGDYVRGRLDLTHDRLFTLSEGSREILAGLDDIVHLTFFRSGDLPQEIQLNVRDVRDLIADLKNASDGMLLVRELNPDGSEEAAEEATAMGVAPIDFNVIGDDEFQVKRGYFGLALTHAGENETIPVIERTDDLEFRLVSAIARMASPELPTLAFLTGFGAREPFDPRLASFRESVGNRYEVTSINMETDSAATLDPDSIDVLVVAAPQVAVPPEVADAVDAYLDSGGAALLLLERLLFNAQFGATSGVATGLESLLADRGVESTGDQIFDLSSHERVSLGQGLFRLLRTYPLWPIATKGDDHATTRNLRNVTFGWASSFTWEEDDPTVTPLWRTTESGGSRPPESSASPGVELHPSEGELRVHTFAVAVNPAEAAGSEGEQEGDDAAGPSGGRIVAVADSDFLLENFVGPNSQNLAFAANAVDWLAQDEMLIGIRSKDRTPPTLVFESDTARGTLKWTSLIGVPALFILLGIARVTGRTKRARRRWLEAQEKEAENE